ncbi:MAG: threonine--tRNA ligase [Clostridiales bacterium]|jgi:threonyl-tRNA synthetase|nr:threonine--tRNA ligase [Clostridiales bacterium]
MQNFKKELINLLQNAVEKLFFGTIISEVSDEKGFYCDFDIPQPLNPDKILELNKHLSAVKISCAYEISGFSGVYLDGDSSEKVLQRIYVLAFETKEELEEYKACAETAAQHDHKKIGKQLDLFSTSDEIGQGLVLWHPKGAIIRYLLEKFSQSAHILNGYDWAYTPHIGRAGLWKTSGHLENFRDSMYNPIDIDGEQYYLKPMNCPFHFIIYNSRPRSYRDLPFRIAEFGNVYRYELSGTLSGLTRVRGFTQDDAHIICTPGQIESEVAYALKFSLYILRAFGLTEFKPYVSTKPEKKSIGTNEQWEMATDVLKKACVAAELDYEIDEGGGAFYGPKIDLKLYDALGREWQCSTIQFDFNLPERFNMKYIGADGKNHTPYVVHRALFGSIERFLAVLIEHHMGDFPLWFAPVQFAIVPIKENHNDYCKRLETALKKAGFRTEADYSQIHMKEKIKRFETQKIPYILIVGDKDIEKAAFSVRSRKHGNLGVMNFEGLTEFIREELEQGEPELLQM